MCTLALLLRPGELLAVSGNRNELLARPASGPRVHSELEPRVLMPRDEVGGGSWLGLNARGLFVAVTNRRGGGVDAERKSRGLLVVEALAQSSARDLHAQLAALPGERHNGFHLVYADLREAFVTVGDGARIEQHALAAGQLHLITERSFGAGERGRKGEGLRERTVAAELGPLGPNLPSLAAWREPMTHHAAEPLEGACVHADSFGYGTRSSFQLLLRPSGAQALWTQGHPCVNAPRDLAPELAELGRAGA